MTPRTGLLGRESTSELEWTKGHAERWRGAVGLRWLAAVGLAWSAGAGAEERPVVAALPVEIARVDAAGRGGVGLQRYEAALRRAYEDALAGQLDVAVAPKREVAAVLSALDRGDYAESDEALAKVAFGAGALYALHTSVRLEGEGATLLASGRVVRDDGRQMGLSVVKVGWARGRRPQEAGREAFLSLSGPCSCFVFETH